MQLERSFGFLTSLDLTKFTSAETKKQIQNTTLQFRNTTQRPTLTQLIFNHSFPSETLITNVQVMYTNNTNFDNNFESIEIEVSSLSNRGHYVQLINLNCQKQHYQITFTGIGCTHCIKISLLLRNQVKKKNFRPGQKEYQDAMQKIISQCVKDINIYGITINSNPSSVQLTKLLNISESFKKYNMSQEAAQTNLLAALSLINARRFVQAAEILRKVSKFYVQKYNNSKTVMDMNRVDRSWTRQQEDSICGISTIRSNFGSGRILESNKFLLKAAKIQLLLAETVSHPSLVMQKLQAYHRCNCYASGGANPVPLRPDADLEQTSGNMFPQIINFLLKMLSVKLEPFRVAALKSIEFFIQTIGCSIGTIYLQILKEVISTYPNNFTVQTNTNKIPYGLLELQIQINHQKSYHQQTESGTLLVKNKILIDHYHHLLETLLSLLPQINKRIILSTFSDIVLPNILVKSPSLELKFYMLRFSEKAISISGADLNIQVSFVGLLIGFCQQKNILKSILNGQSASKKNNSSISNFSNLKEPKVQMTTGQNKHVIHNIVYYSQKIINTLKSKVLPRYSGPKLQSFLKWINSTLTYLGQNELLSNTNSGHSLFVFSTILQFIMSIYSTLKDDFIRLKFSPIQTILYFTNMVIHNNQTGLPFEKILESLYKLLNYHSKMDDNFELNKEIVQRILQKSKQNNLSLKELQILMKSLETINGEQELILQWLNIYLGCIPHSTYDETYQVFCLLLSKGIKKINQYPQKQKLLKKLVKTMLDQYTVKGKAHQQAKQTLIQSLIKESPQNLVNLFQICLFHNLQPKPENYYSKRKVKGPSKIKKQVQHHFDSKSYKIDVEMFMQKISFAQLLLTKISVEDKSAHILIQEGFVNKFFESIQNLIQNPSMKLKSKALSLVNHYLQLVTMSWKNQKIKLTSLEMIIKYVFNVGKLFGQKLKDSKLMYSALYNILSLFRCHEDESIDDSINEKIDIEKIYDQIDNEIKIESPFNNENEKLKRKRIIIFNLILLREFLKIWATISQSLSSPWENVRQIYLLLLLEVFKQGLGSIPLSLKEKTVETLKALLVNLFSSTQHSERQGGLKLFGCLLGLRKFFENKPDQISRTICENLRYVKPLIEHIFEETYDWNSTTAQIAENLCEICMPDETRRVLNAKKKENLAVKLAGDMEGSYLSLQQNAGFNNNLENILMRESSVLDDQSLQMEENYSPIITEQLLIKIIQFKNLIEKQIQARTEVFGEKESFLEQNEEQFYDMGEEKAESVDAKQKSQDDQLQFEDLGIIELDDEEWGQEEKEEKVIQKLSSSIKKNYKLSPGVLNSSKPQRIRSKRFHQNEFDYRQKIIVDEVEEKINNGNYSNTSIPNSKQRYIPKRQVPQESSNENIEQSHDTEEQRIPTAQTKVQKIRDQPLIVDDFDEAEEEIIAQQYDKNEQKKERNESQQLMKKEAKREKGFSEKEHNQKTSNKEKQKEGEKKLKKATSTRKRKQSISK